MKRIVLLFLAAGLSVFCLAGCNLGNAKENVENAGAERIVSIENTKAADNTEIAEGKESAEGKEAAKDKETSEGKESAEGKEAAKDKESAEGKEAAKAKESAEGKEVTESKEITNNIENSKNTGTAESSESVMQDSSGLGYLIVIDAGHQKKGNSEKEPVGPGAGDDCGNGIYDKSR